MRIIYLLILLFTFLTTINAQNLDTLRIDTCFNIGFQKNQIDMYYLEHKEGDFVLKRQRAIQGIQGFPKQIHETFYTNHYRQTDKLGKHKDGDLDTLEIKKMDGSLNYLIIKSYGYESWSDELVLKERYAVPDGKLFFYDYHPSGKAFRQVLIDGTGKMIGEISNNQIDSFGTSFTQLDKNGRVVVFQSKTEGIIFDSVKIIDFEPLSEEVIVKYDNVKNVTAFRQFRVNDSTFCKEIYQRDGNLKIRLTISYSFEGDFEDEGTYFDGLLKTIHRENYNNGVLITE